MTRQYNEKAERASEYMLQQTRSVGRNRMCTDIIKGEAKSDERSTGNVQWTQVYVGKVEVLNTALGSVLHLSHPPR
jgi:hypothetical protein